MLDIRKRIFIIAGGGIFLVLVIILFLLFRPKAPPASRTGTAPTTSNASEPQNVPNSGASLNFPPASPPATAEERDKLYVVQLTKIFVERYLSHSNQNENTHISDVEVLVTPRLQTYLQTQAEKFTSEYKGISTKVIASSLASYESGQATVTIGAQQFIEEKNKPGVTVYKNGRVTFVKGEDGWKVDGLFWEEL